MVEGGVYDGVSPITDPIAIFLLQLIVIICFTRGLARAFMFLKQPLVIWEVIGGICLGPSVLGNIPHFSTSIFPTSSLPTLNAVATVGLVLYLFLMGMEIDLKAMKANFRRSAAISITGIAFPFGLGAAASIYVYNDLIVGQTAKVPKFASFCVFIALAMSITAFPVLARILIDQKLTRTSVGVVTISAAAVDDATAWSLLALVISMLTASDNFIVALWVFLTLLAWALFVLVVFRPLYAHYVAYMTKKQSRTNFLIATTFAFIFISAYVTQILGVHAMFGGFLMGLAVPHDSEFAIKLTEKIEDFNGSVWLPLYFAYSGLNTNIKQLNSGPTWAAFFLVVSMATVGKFGGCTLAAKIQGNTSWREAATIGILMNTKGLVELIVLNLGLSIGVINTQVFTVMVLMAIVTTVATTPIVKLIYPPKYRVEIQHPKLELVGDKKELANLKDVDTVSPVNNTAEMEMGATKGRSADMSKEPRLTSLRVCTPFHNVNEAASICTFMSSFGSSEESLVIGAYHLFELSDSFMKDNILSMMKNADPANQVELTKLDSNLKMITLFGKLVSSTDIKHGMTLSNEEEFAREVSSFSASLKADIILLPMYRDKETSLIAKEFNEVDYVHYLLEVANLCNKPYALFVDQPPHTQFSPRKSLKQRVAVVVQDTKSNEEMFSLVRHLLAKSSSRIDIILFAPEALGGAEAKDAAPPRATLSLQASELIKVARSAYKGYQSSIDFHHMSSDNNFEQVRKFLNDQVESDPFDLVILQAEADLPIGYVSTTTLLGSLGEFLLEEKELSIPLMVVHAPPSEEVAHETAAKTGLSFLNIGAEPYQVKVTGSKKDILDGARSRSLHEIVLRSSKEKFAVGEDNGEIDSPYHKS